MKINKENAGWIFCCALLAGLLILSICLGLSGWYFKTEQSSTNDMQLGKTVQTPIMKNQASAISLNLSGSFLPGEKLPQVISVKNEEQETAVYLRAKAFITSGENVQSRLNLVETASWRYNEDDGYYYCVNLLTPQNKIALCSHIYTDSYLQLMSTKDYIITFVFETLDENEDVFSLWKINPIENI